MSYSVTIEPKFVHARGLLSKVKLPKAVLVQGDVFKLGLKITNIGKDSIPSFTIHDIQIKPTEGGGVIHLFKKSYKTGILNPNEETTLWISDFGTDMFGLACIEIAITPPGTDHIDTHQINRFNSEEEGKFTDKWMDFFYIKSSHEHTQERTNTQLHLFALATVIFTVFQVSLAVKSQMHQDERERFFRTCVENSSETIVKFSDGYEISCGDYLKYSN